MARMVGSGIGVSLWYAKQIRLTNIQPLTMGQFGVSVTISDHNVLIGGAGKGTSGIDIGQAHLFDTVTGILLPTFDVPMLIQAHLFSAATGALLQTFNDPLPQDNSSAVDIGVIPFCANQYQVSRYGDRAAEEIY